MREIVTLHRRASWNLCSLDLIFHLRDRGSNRDWPASKTLERTSVHQNAADCIQCGCGLTSNVPQPARGGLNLGWPCEVRLGGVIGGSALALVHPLAMPAVYPIRGHHLLKSDRSSPIGITCAAVAPTLRKCRTCCR